MDDWSMQMLNTLFRIVRTNHQHNLIVPLFFTGTNLPCSSCHSSLNCLYCSSRRSERSLFQKLLQTFLDRFRKKFSFVLRKNIFYIFTSEYYYKFRQVKHEIHMRTFEFFRLSELSTPSCTLSVHSSPNARTRAFEAAIMWHRLRLRRFLTNIIINEHLLSISRDNIYCYIKHGFL